MDNDLSKEKPKEIMVMKSPPKLFRRKKWTKFDRNFAFYFLTFHLLCILAPFCFSWTRLLLALGLSYLSGMGISVSYHRNLAHRSFKLPKRFVDSERDPHSPIYGFWFSQMTWLFDSYNLTRKVCPNYFNNYQKAERNIFMLYMKHGYPDNVPDLEKQWFYRFIHKTYWLHPLALSLLLYAIGGLPFIIWGMCVRFVYSVHVTSMVNSVCHMWGNQPWNTGDLSKNNWMVALLTFGEGWHNNHHAFEYSARHGLEWWQIDYGWYFIRFLEVIGLATNVKFPSEKQKLAALNKSKPTFLKPTIN